MGRETFEDSIRKKFEGQTVKAPGSVWSDIEHTLNAELVQKYKSQNLFYRWVSVAAFFIVMILLGAIYQGFNVTESQPTNSISSRGYNALLAPGVDYGSYYDYQFKGIDNHNLFYTSSSSNFNTSTLPDTNFQVVFPMETKSLAFKKPELFAPAVSSGIYTYLSAPSYSYKPTTKTENHVYAGINAGAGSFNANLNDGAALANSLNSSALAFAVGSGSFVNPTTSITSDMNEAIATTVGVDFGVKMGNKWTLESGLAYTAVENTGDATINVLDIYTIDNSEFTGDGTLAEAGINPGVSAREASMEVRQNYDHTISLTNRVQFASIPVKAGYQIIDEKKFSFKLNAGVAANYMVDGSISDPSRQILNSTNLSLYNEWSFDGIGGVELGYTLFNKFDFTIAPNYRHSLTPISTTSSSPSRFLIQTGLRYTLK